MDAGKPYLLQVPRPALGWASFRNPQIRSEKRSSLVDRNRVAADLDIGIIGRIRKPQRVFVPPDRAYRVPHTDEPWRASACCKGVLELLCKLEICLFLCGASAIRPFDVLDSHQH